MSGGKFPSSLKRQRIDNTLQIAVLRPIRVVISHQIVAIATPSQACATPCAPGRMRNAPGLAVPRHPVLPTVALSFRASRCHSERSEESAFPAPDRQPERQVPRPARMADSKARRAVSKCPDGDLSPRLDTPTGATRFPECVVKRDGRV